MFNVTMGYEMEPLKENVISNFNVKENNTQELSLEKSVLEKKDKRRLFTLYETLNHKYFKKEFWFQMSKEDCITLSWGENKMEIWSEEWETPSFDLINKKCHISVNGFELYCHPVDGSYNSDTEKDYKKFIKIWRSVISTMKNKNFWKKEFKMFWEESDTSLF